MSGERVRVSDVRHELKPQIFKVIKKYARAGWTLRRQGHKFYFYCPCGEDWVRVDGTPRNPDRRAKQIELEIKRCPDRHRPRR